VARFDREIPPGKEGKITLELDTEGIGRYIHKAARVYTNDPDNDQFVIAIKGEIWVPVKLRPRHARLVGVIGDKINRIVTVKGNKEDELKVKITQVSHKDKFEAELKKAKEGGGYVLDIKNKVDKESSYHGWIRMSTNYPEKPEVVLQVSGNVIGVIKVFPSTVNFGQISSEVLGELKKKKKVITRSMTVRLNKGKALEIKALDVERSLFKVTRRKAGSHRVAKFYVEPALESLKKGMNRDRLTIRTNQKGYEILEVPIVLEVL